MKYILGILIMLLATSCYKDLGNYDYGNKTAIQIDSIKNLYEIYSGDTLHIVPEITSYSKVVSYEWSLYDSLQQVTEVTVLSTEKDLHQLIVLPQGIYQIEYRITDADGYTQIATSIVNVITEFSEGFYVLKEIEGNSDLDLYPSNANPISDLMLNLYEERLRGVPQDLFIAPNHQYIDDTLAKMREYVIYPVTEEETRMIKVQDMETLFNYEDFFYLPPAEKEQPMSFVYGSISRTLLTDCNAYTYNTMAGWPSGKYNDHSAYINGDTAIQPAPYVAVSVMGNVTFYDNLNGQFLYLNDFGSFIQYKEETGRLIPPFGLNCNIVYMRQPKSGGTAYAIMENKDNKQRYIFTLDKIGSTNANPIGQVDTLPENLHIYEAENFTISEDGIFIFYNVRNQLYSYEIANKQEMSLNLNLDGEHICMIDYLYCLRAPAWHKFIVATSNGKSYKLYLFDAFGNRPDSSVSPIIYEGNGKPKAIHYVRPNLSSASQYPFNG